MSVISFLKAAVGGVVVILCLAFLAASPAHAPLSAVPLANRERATRSLAQDRPPDASPRTSSRSAAEQSSRTPLEYFHGPRVVAAEQFFFSQANRERAEKGLPQLKWNEGLAAAARKHASLMLNEGDLSHQFDDEPSLATRVSEVGVRFTRVGENVAFGPETASIHAGWMESPGHRANILGASFNALGVGVQEENGRLYAVEDFAAVVGDLTIEQQEEKVAAMLTARGFLVSRDQDDLMEARGICARGAAPGGSLIPPHREMEILRYETADLSTIAPEMEQRLKASRFRETAVGACKGPGGDSRFHGVILIFPATH
jgi:uncharacterized protein YkwD